MASSHAHSDPSADTHPTTADSSTPSTDTTMAAVMSATKLSPRLSPLTTANLSMHNTTSPPHSNASSPGGLSARRARSPRLSMDMSNIPPLSSPAPPSNTLLITRLDDPKIFHPASLATIRQHLESMAPLNSFSPLKSMARLIVSFYDEAAAIKVRQEIDRTAFAANVICKCYFGEPTPIGDEKKYLERPDAGKLFFISPPPSPPVGWEMKNEDPPNTKTHADDLLSKLQRLTGRMESDATGAAATSPPTEVQAFTADELAVKLQRKPSTKSQSQSHKRALSEDLNAGSPPKMRSRSSTLIYDPKVHGDSPGLPAVMLEAEDESDVELDSDRSPTILAHTARPPVELMNA